MKPIAIVPYNFCSFCETADLYHASVHAIDPAIYTEKQQEAWAPTPPNYDAWHERLKITQPFLALVENKIVGFIELEDDGHIDCAYTHPHYQKCGVMTHLYNYIELYAYEKKHPRLYVEASFIIQSFIEKRAFRTICENTLVRNGCILTNYSMEKILRS